MALQQVVYWPRDAEHTVLHQVVAEHLEAFLHAAAIRRARVPGIPDVRVIEHGVARFRCEGSQ